MLTLFSLLGVLLLIPRTAPAQSVAPGTYRIWICAEVCAPTDSSRAVAEAVVVLLGDSLAQADSVRSQLAPLRRIRRRDTALDNACFRVVRRERNVGREELFFGIQPAAATRVLLAPDDRQSLRTYASPDAFFDLIWATSAGFTRGEGWAAGPFADNPWHRNSYFVALHIGPPSVAACSG